MPSTALGKSVGFVYSDTFGAGPVLQYEEARAAFSASEGQPLNDFGPPCRVAATGNLLRRHMGFVSRAVRRRAAIAFVPLLLALLVGPYSSRASAHSFEPPSAAMAPRHVLFLSSYHSAFPTFFDQLEGLRSVLEGQKVRIDVEGMDSKRFFDATNLRLFRALFEYKLSRLPPYDVVIAADDNALHFALGEEHDVLHGAPLVFLGINDVPFALRAARNGPVTGVLEEISPLETLREAKHLLPDLRRVVLLVDGTPSGQGDLERIEGLRPEIEAAGLELELLSLTTLSWDELAARLRALEPGSALLLLSAYRDRLGESRTFDRALELVVDNLRVPLLHLWEHGLGDGVLGGKLICFRRQGRLAGELVLRILRGEAAGSIAPIRAGEANRFAFDQRQLDRFGIPDSRLPPDAAVIGRKPNPLQGYLWPLVAGLLVVVCQALALGALFFSRRKLRRSEERYRAVFEHSPLGLILFDPTGTIVHCNEQFAELMGVGVDRLIGFNTVRQSGNPKMAACLTSALEGRRALYEDLYTSALGHKSLHLRVLFQPLGERPPCRVIAILEDVTERKAAEQALQDYKALVEHSQEIMAVVDENGIYRVANEAMLRQHGILRSEALGHPAREVLGDRLFGEIEAHLQQCIHGESLRFDHVVELPGNGGIRHMEVSYSPIPGGEGKGCRVAVVLRDVTPDRLMREELVHACAQAEAAGRAKNEFLANMSHEIRTPLNGVLGMLQLLGLTTLDRTQSEYVSTAMESCARLSHLLTDILDISRIEAGRMPLRSEPFSLRHSLDDVRSMFEDTAREKGLGLTLRCADDVPDRLMGDATRLRQVLFNLVGNGLKFTTEGGVLVEVDVLRRTAADARLYFSVSDTGMGIEDEQLDYVFDVFTQADGSIRRQHQGAGLGLPIVKRIVTLMGGHLSVESEPGRGSSFHFSLRFDLADAQVAERAAPDKDSPACRGVHALVVESHELSRVVLRRMLERLGMLVEETPDPGEALRRLRRRSFDIVFLSVPTPGDDGEGLLRQLRSAPEYRHLAGVPIVVVSADPPSDGGAGLLAAGADHVLSKPLSMESLHGLVRDCLSSAGLPDVG